MILKTKKDKIHFSAMFRLLDMIVITDESERNRIVAYTKKLIDNLNNEDILFDDENCENMEYDDLKEIQVTDIQKGDYVCVECERLYNSTSYLEILDIGIRFDSQTGAIIKTVTTEDDTWSTNDGRCISNPNSFYEAVGYYRKTK